MGHKQFQIDGGGGFTNIQFNLHHYGELTVVENIRLYNHSQSNLPESAFLEYDYQEMRWRLCTYLNSKDGAGNLTRTRQWINSPMADQIVTRILDSSENQNQGLTNPS